MTVQNETLIDDSTSCTSEDTASTSTMTVPTTTPLTVTENNHNVQSAGPLYTPIAVPEPRRATMVAENTENATALEVEAEMAAEEASTSALIHAACRLHEATLVTTNAFHELYYRWARLTSSEVEYEANRMSISLWLESGADWEKVLHHKTRMLYVVATAMQTLNKVASCMAGLTVNTRDRAVAQRILLPLSALQDKDVAAKFASFTRGATETALRKAWNDLWDRGKDTMFFSRVTMNVHGTDEKKCFPWAERTIDISNVIKLASFATDSVEKAADAWDAWKATGEGEGEAEGAGEPTEPTEPTDAKKASSESEQADRIARRKVQRLVYSGLFQSISNAAETTSQAVNTASKIARWKRPWRSISEIVFGNRTTTHRSDDALLKQARDACKQAVAAIKEARERMPPTHD